MESNTTNKHKPRPPFTESNSSRDGSTSGNQWQEGHRDHRRDITKNRERGRDGEWNRDRPFLAKSRDNSRDEDKIFREDPAPSQPVQQPAAFPAYNYNSADHSYVDNNRRALSMMCNYGLASMSGAWGVNQMDTMTMNSNTSAMPISTGMEMVPPNPAVVPYAYMGMPADSMYGVVGMGNYCQYGMMGATENMMFPPIKEVIQLTKSVLYPPNPNAPRPTTRGKPLGCKTVFVGGLPEKATEEIIKEIFDRCGTVETIRMSKKNFCHIRFSSEMFVENAIYFSGYRIKIENKDEASHTGRLHVDYAQARDDQYDYECKQRSLQRQQRHQEQDYYRSVTPPVVHYSEHEASLLVEKLRSEETFSQAALILITWLERGECTKRNAGTFYSMIQSTNNHVRRLQVDKSKYEEQLNEAKKMLKQNLAGIIRQFDSIVKVYKAVSLQKVWDHFTKAQRKNIEMWRKQTEELRNAHVEEVINERVDEEMELSEDENEEKKSSDVSIEQIKSQLEEEIHKLQEESDSLRCQIETLQNEIMVLYADHEEDIKRKDAQISALRQAVQNAKKELLESRASKRRREDDDDDNLKKDNNDGNTASGSNTVNHESEARLIGLISTFLHVHPFGANIDYICSYLHQIDSSIKARDVENLLKRFPSIFREDSTGIGASLGKKWRFTGFQT